MATDPLAFETPNQIASAPVPGLFDGQMNAAGIPSNDMIDAAPMVEPMVDPMVDPMVEPMVDPMATPVTSPITPQEETDLQPETQVAGLPAEILKAIMGPAGKKMGTKTKIPGIRDVIPEGSLAGVLDNHVIIREATPEEVVEFSSLTGKTEGVPSPTATQRAEGMPVAEFNLENITGPDELKATIDRVSKMWTNAGQVAGRGKMSFDEIKELADDLGFGETVERLLRRTPSEAMNAETITASLQAVATSGMELNRLAKIAAKSNDSRELLKFRQHLAFHSAIQIQMKGAQAEAGRALAAFRIPRGVGSQVEAEAVQNLMQEFGGQNSVRDMAKSYLDLPSMSQRNQFSYGAWDKIKGTWMEIWINGLLSAPGTHIVNMTGNTIFQLVQIPERFGAGLIGAARQAFGSKEERVYIQETAADIFGLIQGIGDGFRMGYHAFKTEAPVRDVVGKIEAAQRQMITGRSLTPERLEGTTTGDYLSKGIDYIGAGIRLPGRMLLAEDEFYKAVAYRRELNSLAIRKASDMRRNGASVDDIDEAMSDIFTGRDTNISMEAENFAQYATFTNPVEGGTGQLGSWVQASVLGRMMVPFFKTPANIFKAAMERSPIGLVSEGVKSVGRLVGLVKKEKNPIKRDILLARAAMGSMVMGWAGSKYAEGRLTGSGPRNYALRNQMESIGWKRWSIVSAKEGIDNPRWLQVGHQLILHPEDVDYTSYSRMEPVSMVLAVAADVTERFRYPVATQVEGEDITMSALDTVFDYMKEQTFLRGIANIANLISKTAGPQREQAASRMIQDLVGSQVPYSSLLANIERVNDPRLNNIIPDRNEPMGLRDLYAGLARMDERLPFGDQEGSPLRDRFATPRISKGATVRETLLPPFIADIFGDDLKKIESDPVMVAVLEAGVPLNNASRKVMGVPLTATEYDTLVKLSANLPGKDAMGKFYPSFYDELKETVESKTFIEGTMLDKQTLIRSVDSDYKSDALYLILEDDEYAEQFADLREKVAQQKEIIENVGRQIQ